MMRQAKARQNADNPLMHVAPWGAIFEWRLPELMLQSGFRFTTALHEALTREGLEISYSHLNRLTQQSPERLNVDTEFTLCRVLGCTPADLWREVGAVEVEKPVDARARRKLATLKPISPDDLG